MYLLAKPRNKTLNFMINPSSVENMITIPIGSVANAERKPQTNTIINRQRAWNANALPYELATFVRNQVTFR